MAASNGTSSAAHNARSIGSGCSSRSRESSTGPPNSVKISACAAMPRSAIVGADRTFA